MLFRSVYKLSAVRPDSESAWSDRLKVSESAAKTTIPGVLNVRRYFDEDGKIAGDMVFDVYAGVDGEEVIVDPVDPLRRKRLKGLRWTQLLVPLARGGRSVDDAHGSAMEAQARAREQLETLDETQLRMLNPHTYPVGFERGLHDRRSSLVARMRNISE